MHGTALITRQTIEEVCATRNRALKAYEIAYQKIVAASEAISEARIIADQAAPNGGDGGRFTYHLSETWKEFNKAVQLPDKEFYLQTAKLLVDTEVWSRLIAMTGIEMLMDAEAKEQLHQSMMEQPPGRRNRRGETLPATDDDEDNRPGMPEITPENVRATLQRFQEDAAMIFQRGIVNAFTRLDRRFRSHDGFKIGGRMILTYCFNDSGRWNYGRRSTQDTLVDVERTFAVLDGKPKGYAYGSIIRAVEDDRRGWEAQQSVTEGEYFRIKGYKNGNAHLWFTRDDLLEKVNKILADYYGEVIGDGMNDGCEADPLQEIKTTPARYFGFYPTPERAAQQLFESVPLYRRDEGGPPLKVLEPSAGTGNLARLAINRGAIVDCVEIQPHLAELLNGQGYRKVYNQDFLALGPETTGLYDVIVMNPPFDLSRDIDHVVHAWEMLEPGGCLCAIMSAGTEFRETRKAIAFRALMEKHNARYFDMPLGSFSEVGTNVNTLILKVYKDGRSFYR